ncbi:MAG: ComEC/Rec2 family competence protein, partial [Gammaproteobacteria bacterium]|nr:ComEC/Rec2 family competence protein [Gammaproteobacteria bacterium]
MDYKPGMYLYALAFLLGVLILQQFAVLPSLTTLYLLLMFLIIGSVVFVVLVRQKWLAAMSENTSIILSILMIYIGIVYSSYYASGQLSLRLDERLSGQNILVQGLISSIPVNDDKVSRFEFDVDSHRLLASDADWQTAGFPKRIRLSWYSAQQVSAGQRWQLEVRLKPPHGFMNPGGFDYEAWLFQHGIDATGYVRKSALNRLQLDARFSVNQFRQAIATHIDDIVSASDAAGGNSFALVRALAIGDKSSISVPQWRVLSATGTSHLMAISGLHIGLASLFFYVLIRWGLPV